MTPANATEIDRNRTAYYCKECKVITKLYPPIVVLLGVNILLPHLDLNSCRIVTRPAQVVAMKSVSSEAEP